jgi:hypothetical protein
MNIDIISDDTLTLAEACRLLPRGRNGARPHLSTILRWILDGAPAVGGERVRLAALRVGGKWVTSRAALQAFAEALTPASRTCMPSQVRTPTQRQRDLKRTERNLDNNGI